MENGNLHSMQVKKKARIKKLCYVALVILIILLLMPPAFRLFVKDKNSGEVKEEDVVIILNCNNSTESITSTFLNGKPGTLTYKIRGNYYSKSETTNPDEKTDENNTLTSNDSTINDEKNTSSSEETNESTIDNNTNTNETSKEENIPTSSPIASPNSTDDGEKTSALLNILSKHGEFQYDSIEDASTIKMPISNLEGIPEYEAIFSSLQNQQGYYELQGFSCTATKLD